MDYESLLAIGMTLVMAGIITRGFAANSRRDQARRKQHQLDESKPDAINSVDQLTRSSGWLEKNLGLLANVVLVTGVALTALAFYRR